VLGESLSESIGVRFAEARLPLGAGELGCGTFDCAVADVVGIDQGGVVWGIGGRSEQGLWEGGEKCSSGCEGHGGGAVGLEKWRNHMSAIG
jgi:hypothetical protein